jgi:hypothetical protein
MEAYKNLTLGVSPITKTVFAGRLNKKGNMWIQKTDVTNQFLSCCIEYFKEGEENIISVDGKPFAKITREKIEPDTTKKRESDGTQK